MHAFIRRAFERAQQQQPAWAQPWVASQGEDALDHVVVRDRSERGGQSIANPLLLVTVPPHQ
jgi:hypothetical protein